ncbi:MAG TPA: pseudaminic acid synthase, partial [Verrucomicrobiales bacterium]|nr:pseudaminic acid synthase [Verrucomicrobiales bacterium]
RVHYAPSAREAPSRAFRKSLFVCADIAEGQPFTEENVRCIRPGDGLHSRHLDQVLASRARRALKRGT